MSRRESGASGERSTPAAGVSPRLCPPLGQERSNKLFGWEKEMEEVTEMGGAHGGG